MDYIIKSANDNELDAMMRYAKEVDDEFNKKNDSSCKKVSDHRYVEVLRTKNKLIRVCQECEFEKTNYWTNDQRRYIEKNLEDFAQPGSILWEKIYGKGGKQATT